MIELHSVGAFKLMVIEGKYTLMPLFMAETLLAPLLWHLFILFYCVGKHITMIELERPY